MDNLKDTIANISLYDVKAYVRKAQNVVMNYTEMEAKVREATNNEPWGASSTLMQEIANGTNSYSQFHEIMPMIYKRFTEKSAEEWRQIYKALQLLEFLVKNGSERVVDYARSHSAVIDMLKHFHYIDQNGKDQGVNIRNRAKELTNLLNDVEKIRTERKKARSNKSKYSGIGNDLEDDGFGGGSGFGGTGKKYGGFGSDSIEFGGGGYNANKVYGDGGGFNGSNYDGPGYGGSGGQDDEFEEYEVGESYNDIHGGTRSNGYGNSSSSKGKTPAVPSKEEKKAPAPVEDIISFDEPASGSGAAAVADDDDDDFDDFQSATPASAPATTTTTNTTQSTTASLLELFSQPSPSQSQSQPPTINQFPNITTTSSFSSPNNFSNFSSNPSLNSPSSFTSTLSTNTFASNSTPTISSPALTSNPSSTNKPKSNDAFGDLWSSASKKKSTTQKPANTSLASLAQENAQKSMWGPTSSNSNSNSTPNQSKANSSQIDDLLSF